jgi:hypothetical protein
LLAPAAYDIAHRQDPNHVTILAYDEVAKSTAQHCGRCSVERPSRIRDNRALRQVIPGELGIEIVLRSNAFQDVSLGQDPRPLSILVVDHRSAYVLLRHPFGDMAQCVAGADREHDSGHRFADSHVGKVKRACAFVKRQVTAISL